MVGQAKAQMCLCISNTPIHQLLYIAALTLTVSNDIHMGKAWDVSIKSKSC